MRKKIITVLLAFSLLTMASMGALAADVKDPSTAKPVTKVEKYVSEFDNNPWLTKIDDYVYVPSDKAKKDPENAAKFLNETEETRTGDVSIAATYTIYPDQNDPNKSYEDAVKVWDWYNGGLWSKTSVRVDLAPSWGCYFDGYYKQNDTATTDPVPTSQNLQPTLTVSGYGISVAFPWGGSATLVDKTITWPNTQVNNERTAIYDYPKYEVRYTLAYKLSEVDKGSFVFGGNIKGMGSQVILNV